GKREHLKHFQPYKVRPNTNSIPNCWEWGTLNHECIAGIKACVDYWEELGRAERVPAPNRRAQIVSKSRREAILAAHGAIRAHERAMMEKMISELPQIPGLKLYGISDPQQFDQ